MFNRRDFLQVAGGLTAATLASGHLFGSLSPAQRIHVGAQTNVWGVPIKPHEHLLEICESLVQLGYTGFESNYKTLEPQAGNAAQCRKDFAARHIQYIAPFCGVALFDRAKHAAEIDKLTGIARYSAEMGATYMIVSGGRLPHTNGQLDYEAARTMADGLNKLAAACKEEGLKLCYHNHVQEFEDQPSEMSILLKETDPKTVWFNYDVGNAYGVGPDAADFSREHFQRIAIYHVKDAIPTEKGRSVDVDLGAGKINLKGVVAPILNSNWEGWLTVEREGHWPNPSANPEQLLGQSRNYVKQITGV